MSENLTFPPGTSAEDRRAVIGAARDLADGLKPSEKGAVYETISSALRRYEIAGVRDLLSALRAKGEAAAAEVIEAQLGAAARANYLRPRREPADTPPQKPAEKPAGPARPGAERPGVPSPLGKGGGEAPLVVFVPQRLANYAAHLAKDLDSISRERVTESHIVSFALELMCSLMADFQRRSPKGKVTVTEAMQDIQGIIDLSKAPLLEEDRTALPPGGEREG